jgi:hypothetical protein
MGSRCEPPEDREQVGELDLTPAGWARCDGVIGAVGGQERPLADGQGARSAGARRRSQPDWTEPG